MANRPVRSQCPHCDHVAESKLMLAHHCARKHQDMHQIIIVDAQKGRVKCSCGQWHPQTIKRLIGGVWEDLPTSEDTKYNDFIGSYEGHWMKMLFTGRHRESIHVP